MTPFSAILTLNHAIWHLVGQSRNTPAILVLLAKQQEILTTLREKEL